jgi:hypothetical protein
MPRPKKRARLDDHVEEEVEEEEQEEEPAEEEAEAEEEKEEKGDDEEKDLWGSDTESSDGEVLLIFSFPIFSLFPSFLLALLRFAGCSFCLPFFVHRKMIPKKAV